METTTFESDWEEIKKYLGITISYHLMQFIDEYTEVYFDELESVKRIKIKERDASDDENEYYNSVKSSMHMISFAYFVFKKKHITYKVENDTVTKDDDINSLQRMVKLYNFTVSENNSSDDE